MQFVFHRVRSACALLYFLCGLVCFAYGNEKVLAVQDNPYGVCSHLSRWEFPKADESMKMMNAAGIGYFRTGFTWADMEKERGVFDFSRWEKLIELGASNKMEVLAIMPSGVPKYAQPFPRHIDEYAAACAKFAEHFKGRIKYWEVVNEPNHISFWGGLQPNPHEYAQLLKKAYPALKKADPSAKVLYGGLAGVPLDFLETTLKDGVADCFDIMNIHPYHWLGFQEGVLIPKIEALRALMKKYGIGDKPIWITETGYSSSGINPCTPKYIERALKMSGVDVSKTVVAHIGDERYEFYTDAFNGSVKHVFPKARGVKRIDFDGLKTLSPKNHPVLYIGNNEGFPYSYIGALTDYIRGGGVVVSTGGYLFYFDLRLGADGKLERKVVGTSSVKRFRIAIRTWNQKGLEFVKPMLSQKPGYRDTVKEYVSGAGFEDIEPDGYFQGRFFVSDAALGDGDKMIPMFYGVFGDKKIPMGALYKYGGDMKGAFITIPASGGVVLSEEIQAMMIPREFILARSAGVERVFKYCFRSSERDYTRESHFGIVRKNLSPKPAYFAYKTLTGMLGSEIPKYKNLGKVNIATWKNSDGTPVCAVWAKMYEKTVEISFKGDVKSIVDYLGNNVSYTVLTDGRLRLRLDGGVRYITGIENADIERM